MQATREKFASETGRLPSLDGLRAVSILLVIVGHAYRSQLHTGPHTPFWLIVGNASLGVSIFFVISGYLITKLLLREQERSGIISLRNFYVRRIFRIFPACYCYIAVLGTLGIFGVLHITSGDVISAFTFTWNYSPHAKLWAMEHLWSLSVEEQFYLLWPTTLLLLLRYCGRLSAIQFASLLILAAPFSRLLTHLLGGPFYSLHVPYLLHTRMDSLMFGCLCALAEGSVAFERAYKAVSRFVWLFPVFTIMVSPLVRFRFECHYLFTVGYTLEGLSITVSMIWLVRNHNSVCGKILNSRVFVCVGVLSYSLYVWQQLFLNSGNPWIAGHLSVSLIGVFSLAAISYRVIEQPFLLWRMRFEKHAARENLRQTQDVFAVEQIPAEQAAAAS